MKKQHQEELLNWAKVMIEEVEDVFYKSTSLKVIKNGGIRLINEIETEIENEDKKDEDIIWPNN